MESLHAPVASTCLLHTNSTHLTGSQMCVSCFVFRDVGLFHVDPPARSSLSALPESPGISMLSRCQLNQRQRHCVLGGRLAPRSASPASGLPRVTLQPLSPPSLPASLCRLGLVQPHVGDGIQSKRHKWLLNAYNYRFNLDVNFYVPLA